MVNRLVKALRLAIVALALSTVQNTHSTQLASEPSTTRSEHALTSFTMRSEHALASFSSVLRPKGFDRPAWQEDSFSPKTWLTTTGNQPFIVMIDPGHGGSDPGSIGHNGLMEKDLTLDIAKRVKLFLEEHDDIQVRLTRHDDNGLSRQERVDAIRRADADIVISLHFNHLPQSDINLVESYYASRGLIEKSLAAQFAAQQGQKDITLHHTHEARNTDLRFTTGSQRLASTLQQHIYNEVSFENVHAQNAGIKRKMLYVLTRSMLPSALVEISCLSHEPEADNLKNDSYRNRLAASVVDGIRNYHDTVMRVPLTSASDIDV